MASDVALQIRFSCKRPVNRQMRCHEQPAFHCSFSSCILEFMLAAYGLSFAHRYERNQFDKRLVPCSTPRFSALQSPEMPSRHVPGLPGSSSVPAACLTSCRNCWTHLSWRGHARRGPIRSQKCLLPKGIPICAPKIFRTWSLPLNNAMQTAIHGVLRQVD